MVCDFGTSRGHEIFMKSKCKACYTIKNLLLSIVAIFFFMGLSNFPPGLALRGLQCGMMVKLRDNSGSDLDECRAEGQHSNICRKAKS